MRNLNITPISRAECPGVCAGWLRSIQSVEPNRRLAREAALQADVAKLRQLGFPEKLAPAMQRWAREAPDLVGTYAHPAKPRAFYPVTAAMRCGALLRQAAANGIPLRAQTFYYESTRIPPIGIFPLRLTMDSDAATPIGAGVDLLGIRGLRGHEPLAGDAFRRAETTLARKRDVLAGGLLAQLNVWRVSQRRALSKLFVERIDDLRRMLLDCSAAPHGNTTVETAIAAAHWAIVRRVLDLDRGCAPVEPEFGIAAEFYTRAAQYRKLLRLTLEELFQAYGMAIVKGVVTPGNGHVLATIECDGRPEELTVDEQGRFVSLWRGAVSRTLTDDQAREAILSGIPLSRLENLALYGLGLTYHYGSERGQRQRVVDLLSLAGVGRETALSTQVGGDFEHGCELASGLSSMLAYLLFGKAGYRALLEEAAQGRAQRLETKEDLCRLVSEQVSDGVARPQAA